MNSIRRHARIRRYSIPWLCVLTLTLLAGCNPTPGTIAPTAAPVAAAPTPTTLPPTAPPPTPTTLPPTAPPPSPTAAEAPTDSVTAQPAASAGYLVYQRPDGSLWRAE